jgi:NADH-ubiquinone oxidoreductase chain 2
MLIITIFTFILGIALGSQISPIQYTRLAALSLLFSAFLSFNVLYTESLGTGLGMFTGLFQVSSLSQSIETFIFIIASLILIP